jgi:transcriptional regulator with XRE-family HTH domain
MSKVTGKSIGYLSDVLQKRKGPPDSETVEKLESFLDIKDKSLLHIALKERETKPSNLARRVKSRPLLAEALLRMEDMSDEDLEKVIDNLPGNYLLFKRMKVEEG